MYTEVRTVDKESHEIPEEKLGSVEVVRSIYKSLLNEDLIASGNRALCQGLLDGEPPYDEDELAEEGCSGITNVNWGAAGTIYNSYQASLLDTTTSIDKLLSIHTTLGTDAQKNQNNKIISEEITRMLKRWNKFSFNVQNIGRCSVWHGLGVAHWSDNESWMFSSGGLDDFLVPSGTLASEDELDFVFARRSMRPNELMEKIRDEEVAGDLGWDVNAVLDAIAMAASTGSRSSYSSMEDIQKSIKNNRLYDNYATEKPIDIIHCWVKEFDGSITYYITTEGTTKFSNTFSVDSIGYGGESFLYKKLNAYESFDQALTLFPYSIGTNGFIHSIRGLGSLLYPQIQSLNMLNSKLIDSARVSSEVHLRAVSELEGLDADISRNGNYTMIPQGMEVIPHTSLDSSKSLIPAIGASQNMVSEIAGMIDTRSLLTGENKAAMNTSSMDEQRSRINDSFYDQWISSWGRVYREIVRRITNKKYDPSTPGYREIKSLVKRLEDKGVSKEIFYSIDWELTEAYRSIGSGSIASRKRALAALSSLQGYMDEEGRKQYVFDFASSEIGYDLASRYFSYNVKPRVPYEDQKVAELENILLTMGRDITVLPDENHKLHLDVHMPPLEETFAAYESQQLPLEEALSLMNAGYKHVIQHVQFAGGNPLLKDEIASYAQRVQQYGEIIHNGTKKLEYEKAKQANEANQEQAQGLQVDGSQEQEDEEAKKLRYEQGLSDIRIRELERKNEIERNNALNKALESRVGGTSKELDSV